MAITYQLPETRQTFGVIKFTFLCSEFRIECLVESSVNLVTILRMKGWQGDRTTRLFPLWNSSQLVCSASVKSSLKILVALWFYAWRWMENGCCNASASISVVRCVSCGWMDFLHNDFDLNSRSELWNKWLLQEVWVVGPNKSAD